MSSLITDEMVEAVRAAVRYELDAIEMRDCYGAVMPVEDADVITDAVSKAIEPMLEKLVLRRCAEEISLGSEWQVDDPRINYVDVQVDKEFYVAVRAAE